MFSLISNNPSIDPESHVRSDVNRSFDLVGVGHFQSGESCGYCKSDNEQTLCRSRRWVVMHPEAEPNERHVVHQDCLVAKAQGTWTDSFKKLLTWVPFLQYEPSPDILSLESDGTLVCPYPGCNTHLNERTVRKIGAIEQGLVFKTSYSEMVCGTLFYSGVAYSVLRDLVQNPSIETAALSSLIVGAGVLYANLIQTKIENNRILDRLDR